MDSLSPSYRRTPTLCKKKKKASRSGRLTSESLQSLYDSSEIRKTPDLEEDINKEDDCPESDRTFQVKNHPTINNRWAPIWASSRCKQLSGVKCSFNWVILITILLQINMPGWARLGSRTKTIIRPHLRRCGLSQTLMIILVQSNDGKLLPHRLSWRQF